MDDVVIRPKLDVEQSSTTLVADILNLPKIIIMALRGRMHNSGPGGPAED